MSEQRSWRMVPRGNDGDYDLVAGGLTVELSYSRETGRWTFWAVRIDGSEERIGSIDSKLPPALLSVLNDERDAIDSEAVR